MSEVTAIGWRAYAALSASRGRARVVAALSASVYAEAAGELIWIGPPGAALHPRAVLARMPRPGATDIDVALGNAQPWRPPALRIAPADPGEATRALRKSLAALGPPRGFGRLTTDPGADPLLVRAKPDLERLTRAMQADDPTAFVGAARPLLGLGEGLTPSGDDFVGGALFARRYLSGAPSHPWETGIQRVLDEARQRTHPVSAQLLRDLAAGEGWAPLHDLADALGAQRVDAMIAAATRLTEIGHSSGWDLLAGFAAAMIDG